MMFLRTLPTMAESIEDSKLFGLQTENESSENYVLSSEVTKSE